jgi:hypothetical protein
MKYRKVALVQRTEFALRKDIEERGEKKCKSQASH